MFDPIYNQLTNIVKIKISIVIYVKNNEKWLEYLHNYCDKIEVLYNNLFLFEYFIYENNSTDNTKELVFNFIKNRKGNVICENIDTNFKWTNLIDFNRGLHMNFIRNRGKNKFGIMNSDYTLLLDSEIILKNNTIFDMVHNIHNDPTISAITPYTICYNEDSYNSNHYYDTLAIVNNNNIDYTKNRNTCMFKECTRCKKYHEKYNINLSNDNLWSINDEEISVRSAFGGCYLIRSDIYNKCEYDENLFRETNHVCEHVSFNKQVLNYGKIIIKPDIKIISKRF